jgi:hypothetical protein
MISEDILNDINECENIKLIEFNLQYENLEKAYAEHHVLVHLTSDESFGM